MVLSRIDGMDDRRIRPLPDRSMPPFAPPTPQTRRRQRSAEPPVRI